MATLTDTQRQLRALGEAALRLADGDLLDRDWLMQVFQDAPATSKQAPSRPLLTITEACSQLRISRWSLYELIRRQQITTITIGRRRLVPAAEVDRLVRSLAVSGGVR